MVKNMHKLIWKEWQEQRWTLGFASIVLGAIALVGLRARIISDASMVLLVCIVGAVLLPILSSTALVPAERNEGTLRMLLSLPISSRRILLSKSIMGLLQCIVPFVVAALLSVAVAWNREMAGSNMLDLYARAALTSASLFFWMMVLTIGLPSEARAGMLAMGILVFWGIATGGMVYAGSNALVMAAAISPLDYLEMLYARSLNNPAMPIYRPPPQPPALAVIVMVQIVILTPLWLFAANRLKTEDEEKSS